VTDKAVGQIPDGEGTAVEATFTPDGKQVLYRADRNLVLSGIGPDAKKRTLYAGEDVFTMPVIGPDGETVAVLRRLEGDGDVCFGRIGGKSLNALCLADDGWDLVGRPAWRRDGKVLLVPGRKQDDPKIFGIRLYQSAKPYSISPEDWSGRVATDVTTPDKGVIAAAWSPDGKRIAAITNLLSANYELVLAPGDDLELVDPKSTKAEACDFAWRPDGKEIAIVEGDARCSKPNGKVKRITLASPGKPADVADDGRNPVYRPSR
jgi:Tol biopolymer transport system component